MIENETQLKNKLDLIYQKAKEENSCFHGIIELMKNKQTIKTAIHNIKSNRGSMTVGIDKKDVNYYLQMEAKQLIKLIRQHIDNYKPNPVRREYINKGNGKKRPLGIPTMIDRIIQEIARIVLEPIAEAKFFNHSYGFRPYRSCHYAIGRVLNTISRSKTYIAIEGDIKSFFDHINHNKLVEMMWNMGIKDKRFLIIIKKMLRAGVLEDKVILPTEIGTPQGGIISPLLANIYLNNFDWMVAKEFEEHRARYTVKHAFRSGLTKVGRRHKKCFLIRYADDWIILCEDTVQARILLTKIDKYYKHILKLELSKEKTFITDLREKPARFLGFDIKAEKMRLKDRIAGKAIPNKKKLTSKMREVLRDAYNIRKTTTCYDVAAKIELINTKIIGISNYFRIGNSARIFVRCDDKIRYTFYKSIKRKHGGGVFEKMLTPAENLDNRKDRHKGHKTKVPFVEVDGVKIGLTKMSFTPSTKALLYNYDTTPYTQIGRAIYSRRHGKVDKKMRPTIYSNDQINQIVLYQMLRQTRNKRLYNFEYILNRDYAYNRDKGKCRICKTGLIPTNIHCHHVNNRLPLEKINKLSNLATMCIRCHKLIHQKDLEDSILYELPKLTKYRELIHI
ncbi:group II intron reverse transcriptase/maturase [Bacillus paranthracis]|uniref:group II intron reverse transcriptase/maturase n=1 Tax=Bacillus paranthracis TaxID=2026186 RepID=UPI002E1C2BA6|nr:group II intron reverse transcriptase/maturase [Bacillus paranthracis]